MPKIKNAPSVDADGCVVHTLKGHSGCIVELCKRSELHFVRKKSYSAAYNLRLERQIEKQKRLAGIIPLPAIFNVSMENKLIQFEMEYIKGKDFRLQFLDERVLWYVEFMDKLMFFFNLCANTATGFVPVEYIDTKIGSLRDRLRDVPQYLEHRALIDRALKAASDLRSSPMPDTVCHGDMTLENIIFREDGSFVFLDVLDGDISSFWLDISKMFFDLDIGWSLRHDLWRDEITHETRLVAMLTKYLQEELRKKVSAVYPELVAALPSLVIFQGLRVLPYAKDSVTSQKIIASLGKTVKDI